jgi:hypothetical protein
VALRPAELVDGFVREREVDLSGGVAGLLRTQARPLEEALGHPVVPLVFRETRLPPVREPALASVPLDESELLQGRQMV